MNNLPLILIILDGWGNGLRDNGDAVYYSGSHFLNVLKSKYPYTELHAHGRYVGLPADQVGNSEAGHMNIGAGRLVEQDSVKITKSIKNGTFAKNSAFMGAIRHVKKMSSSLHLIGLLSNGQSPHSDPEHLAALLDLCRKNKLKDVYLHVITDGRDSPKYAAMKLVNDLDKNHLGDYRIATVMGRFYAMDRTKKWDRTKKAYDALIHGDGRVVSSIQGALSEAYNRGESDEFIQPYIISTDQIAKSRIKDGDSVIFFNLRSDRSRQLAKVFVQNDFSGKNPGSFDRGRRLEHLYFVAMTDFGPDLDDILTAFPSADLPNALPFKLSGLRQLYLAETEKYAHVTYFFNGGFIGKVANEEQFMIPSPDVKAYDEAPHMSSADLTDKVVSSIDAQKGTWAYDFVTLNFAAPDMIGHTGNLLAAIETCRFVDECVKRIVDAYLAVGGTVIVTADHGNIEQMIDPETGEVCTEHTTNKVPFHMVNERYIGQSLKDDGSLSDIAPTILDLIGIKKDKEMTGRSLIINKCDL